MISARAERQVKVIVIGDATVGKTSFVLRYVNNSVPSEYKTTIGVDYSVKVLPWSHDLSLHVQIWDIGGQDRFRSLLRIYYKGTHVCVIMFDLSVRQTFSNVLYWKQTMDQQCRMADGSKVPCLLLANKCDLAVREVEDAELDRLCQENSFTGWRAVSAKTGRGIEDAMKCLLSCVVEQHTDPHQWNGPLDSSKILLGNNTYDSEDDKGDCIC